MSATFSPHGEDFTGGINIRLENADFWNTVKYVGFFSIVGLFIFFF